MGPIAYFITFTTYGTWLHGRAPGSVDRKHNRPGTPLLPPDADRERQVRSALRQESYVLDTARRKVVLRTIREVAVHRGWIVWAVHVRSNHVHVVLTADCTPEKLMVDLKAWCSRRLREAFDESADRDRWTQHGSTRYLNDETSFQAAVVYVLDEQGEPMERYDGRMAPSKSAPNEPEA
jgi:REP element-mobilizing transposase RayT